MGTKRHTRLLGCMSPHASQCCCCSLPDACIAVAQQAQSCWPGSLDLCGLLWVRDTALQCPVKLLERLQPTILHAPGKLRMAWRHMVSAKLETLPVGLLTRLLP